ncbi:hypothetical protein [Rubrivirga sp.]|uniref:hypothetical protein n=1 Tax=Rubrivirga sp. TaxID=1885344 RepID=UPI003B51C9FF
MSADTPTTAARVLVGIDPGTTTGLASVDVDTGAVLGVSSAGPLETVRQLEALAAEGRLAGAYLEDARALPLYARHGRANRGQRDRIARGVGQVDGLTDLYVSLLTALSVPFQCVEPSRRKKWSAEVARRLTGYQGRTNEHGRDALRLVYGRSVPGGLFDLADTSSGGHGNRSTTRRGAPTR